MRIRSDVFLLLASLALPFGAPRADAQAQIIIVNANKPGEGFNDPTPVAPVGGNDGTTLGAQRLRAFEYAASLWAWRVRSRVPIRVRASFDPLPCDATSAVLGSAGPLGAFRDFGSLPESSTWYTSALANSLVGRDLDPAVEDVNAQFNSSIGTTCAFPRPWYYGLDGEASPFEADLVTIVHHELCHGLGFVALIGEDGKKLNGLNDAFMKQLFDAQRNASWPNLTDAQRAASSVNTANLVWNGSNVTAAGRVLAAGTTNGRVRLYAPNPYEAGSSVSHFDTSLSPPDTMGPAYQGPNHAALLCDKALLDMGWQRSPSTAYLVPSSAHLAGANGAFFTTDVTVSNRGLTNATLTFKFLGNNRDGRFGEERTVALATGRTVTYTDILSSMFGLTSDFGAIRILSDSDALNIVVQTSTPGGGGTYGQSLPAARPSDLIVPGATRSITALREDGRFRTNLILANASEGTIVVDLALSNDNGDVIGSRQLILAPYEMQQLSRVAQILTGSSGLPNATLTLSTPTVGGALAAYASVIDNATNDPRTLLPR